MTVLRAAVAIGDNQLVIDAPLSPGQVPGYLKVDDELLMVGGQDNRGTTLVLSRPAAATHSNGATVTYAGNPFDAAFLAATAGEGGGGGGTQEVYVQDDDPGAVGAGKLWVQTVPGAPDGLRLQMWVRATGDAEWLPVGAADSVLGVVEAPGGTGITRYDADFLSLSDVVVSDTGGTVGLIRIDIMRSPGGEARAKWEQTDTGILMEVFDDNEDSEASLELTAFGNATLVGASTANLDSDGDVESNNNTILTNPPIAAPASHVADGATVDDLRDALVAAGLMEPAP